LSWWSRQPLPGAARSGPPRTPQAGLLAAGPDGIVSEWQARELLESAGGPFVPAALARSADEAAVLAAGVAGAVAVKLASPDVPHKSDIGAVRLGVAGADAVRRAFADVIAAGHAHRAALRVEGVQVSPMRRGGVELLVGVTRDAQWGLAIAVGLG